MKDFIQFAGEMSWPISSSTAVGMSAPTRAPRPDSEYPAGTRRRHAELLRFAAENRCGSGSGSTGRCRAGRCLQAGLCALREMGSRGVKIDFMTGTIRNGELYERLPASAEHH